MQCYFLLIFLLPAAVSADFRFPSADSTAPRSSRAVLFVNNDAPTIQQQQQQQPRSQLTAGAANSIPANTDRWAWPSSASTAAPVVSLKPSGNQEQQQRQSRQNAKQELLTKKSVAKPYRVLTKVSSCPKLLHDLNITCGLPNPRQNAVFQWRKTLYGSPQHQVAPFEQEVKIAVAHGTSLLVRENRYSVDVTPSSSTLSIRQLKVSDCGLFTCEALHANGTIIAASDIMVYLCF